MAFFDEHQDLGGGNWVKAEEKAVLMENGIPLQVTAVIDDDANTYEGRAQPRYVVVALVPNPEDGTEEERQISFAKGTGVESRDRMLAAMIGYLARQQQGDETAQDPIVVKLEKAGRAIVLREA